MQDNMGLTTKQVQQRIQQGCSNASSKPISKTRVQICKENICTLFNLLNVIIAIALAFAGAWTNIIFMLIILANITIGILQELHAKKLVDTLSVLMVSTIQVIRDHQHIEINCEELVIDDVMCLQSGQQICCDARVVDGRVEVNEALLTGESDPVFKTVKDTLLSGSSIIAGKCHAQVVHVGNDNYASTIANDVKKQRAIQSILLQSMRKVTKITCILILPLGALLLFEAFGVRHSIFYDGILACSAALLGMLPKGLVLLISVSLANGAAHLAKKKILVQDLYALETMAHIDTLCLDKTGTITNGLLHVEQLVSLCAAPPQELDSIIASYLYHSQDNNATFAALSAYFTPRDTFPPTSIVPFSSKRKWSSAYFASFGSLVMGAPDKLLPNVPEQLQQQMRAGKRVVILGRCHQPLNETSTSFSIEPLMGIVIQDRIRKNMHATLTQIQDEGIHVKVISGDHMDTVSKIAQDAGVKHYDRVIDMHLVEEQLEAVEKVAEAYDIFGRVSPLQKKYLVLALQKKGHKVAMSGDGVNDMLALKEADCSIAIAQGSDAVKQMSQIVLLDSDFTYFKDVLFEGRRVVNNITRVAGIFFIKTLYSSILAIFCVVMNIPFPFIPIQITLIDALVEAFPAFISILERDTSPVEHHFLSAVMKKAIPYAITILVMMVIVLFINQSMPTNVVYTLMFISIAVISMQAVIVSCHPMNRLRFLSCLVMVCGVMIALLIFPNLLHIQIASQRSVALIAFISVVLTTTALTLSHIVHRQRRQRLSKRTT